MSTESSANGPNQMFHVSDQARQSVKGPELCSAESSVHIPPTIWISTKGK